MKNNTSNLIESPDNEEEAKMNDGEFDTNRAQVEDPLAHNHTGEMNGLGLLSG